MRTGYHAGTAEGPTRDHGRKVHWPFAVTDLQWVRGAHATEADQPAPERWEEFLNNISTMWATEPNYTEDELKGITTPFLILDGEQEEAIDLNQTNG